MDDVKKFFDQAGWGLYRCDRWRQGWSYLIRGSEQRKSQPGSGFRADARQLGQSFNAIMDSLG